jgi:hypothetical protein
MSEFAHGFERKCAMAGSVSAIVTRFGLRAVGVVCEDGF